jgi:competence protein ComEC
LLLRLPEAVARFLSSQLAMTGAASIAVVPIIAVYFGRLSVVSVATNLLAAPLFVFAIGGSALSAVAAVIDGELGATVGAFGHLPLSLLVWLADLAAGVPLSSLEIAGYGSVEAALTYVLIAFGLYRLLDRRPRDPDEISPRRWRLHWAGVAALTTAGAAAVIWWGVLTPESDRLRVTVLDVGQGDAILIETPHGHRLLVDGGPSGEALMQALGEALPADDRRIDLVVLTHAQDDHVTGLVEFLRRYEVRQVLEGPLSGETGAYAAWRKAVEEEGSVRHRVASGQHIELGGAYVEVLAPDGLVAGGDLNENSVVLRLVYGDVSFLLTGDLGEDGERVLIDSGFDLGSTVLKVGHHGSDGSTTTPFLEAVAPAVAVVSAGEDNPFGHPAPGLRLRLGDTPLFRTDRNGSVRFETDGRSVWVRPEHGTFSTSVPVAAR